MRARVLEFIRHRHGLWNLPAAELERLRARFPAVRFDGPATREEADALLPEADVVLGLAVCPHNLAGARRLRWIHTVSAGLDHVLFPELVETDLVLTNARGAHDLAIAEHALGVLLAFARQLHVARDRQRTQRWDQAGLVQRRPGFRTLAGSTLGIVGFGSIGRALGERARALGMTVLGVRRHPPDEPWPAHQVWGLDRLDELLASSDWIVLALPLTPETRHLIDGTRLSQLRPGAHLINVGRGATLDGVALIEALEQGRLAGAALDVFESEPLDDSSPLWGMESVILTPHISGFGPEYWPSLVDQFARNLERWLAGTPLENVVDKRAGY